jgi:uncharacterized paraquat-inducible protein A
MVPASVQEIRRCGSGRFTRSTLPDREMRCRVCGTRAFTSRAPELVSTGHAHCPRCATEMTLVPSAAAA